ncbi:hypothetical protein [Nostoc sp.]|uniref:hypothetical protein n=1 Tax=Nostoc sp. TaxID=1180 RepID=UPI002FFB6946
MKISNELKALILHQLDRLAGNKLCQIFNQWLHRLRPACGITVKMKIQEKSFGNNGSNIEIISIVTVSSGWVGT